MKGKKRRLFRSIFIKYISAFMLINLVCLGLLSIIITSLIRAYGSENRTNLLKNVALAVENYVSEGYMRNIEAIPFDPNGDASQNPYLTIEQNDLGYSVNGMYPFAEYLRDNSTEIKSVTDLLSESSGNVFIFITDAEGEIALSGGGTAT